jgi:sigma-B regulation protein RsbU (phosphoserine phosphatase)
MFLPDPQFARSDVLRVFNHAQVFLFLGSAIITVGLLAGFFSVLRRRLDPLLLWFALFAILYGLRLEMNYQLLWALGLRPVIFRRVVIAIGYLVPIPAFFFFRALNLIGRVGRFLCVTIWPVLLCLALVTLYIGPNDLIRIINNSIVIAALIVLSIDLVRVGHGSRDIVLIRSGLFFFIVCALYDNVTGIFGHYYNIEPFSFTVLLAGLGIAAGRHALANEQQLTMIQKELDIAQQIQLSILPSTFPTSGSFRIAARYLPMTSVAGDFFDFAVKGEHEASLLIADVSGHGVPAALIASMVKLAASTQSANADRPADVLLGMNSILCGNTQGQFVTAGYVHLNAFSWELRYSAAAHPPMLLLRNHEVTEIAEYGLMLGAFAFSRYTTLTHSFKPGDRIVLYTDGLLEATNVDQEEFGASRLQSLVRDTGDLPVMEAADKIISTIRHWSVSQNDDLTVVICDCTAQAEQTNF